MKMMLTVDSPQTTVYKTGNRVLFDFGLGISALPARLGATPRWDARQRINQVWARDFGLRVQPESCSKNVEG